MHFSKVQSFNGFCKTSDLWIIYLNIKFLPNKAAIDFDIHVLMLIDP